MTTNAARVRAQAGYESRNLLANGEQLLVSLVLPLLALVGLAMTSVPSLGVGRRIDIVTPGVLALAVVSTAFTGQAIATGFDRRYGVLRYLGTTPLGRSGLLWGKAFGVLTVVALQTVVLGGVALAMGWRPHWSGLPLALALMLAGTWAWVALALLLAGALRAEGVLALANLVWVLVAGLGGLLLPSDRLPDVIGQVVHWLPSGALGDGLRSALGGSATDALLPLAVLIGWGAVATALTMRTFDWSD
ncbi:ABC transporter permease [Yimella sp. cx-573]|nr:ABC transporter permease [Yimella sp. cx-573]